MSRSNRLGRDQLCALIPHAGSMCLLEAVEQWDEEHIVCRATSHRDPGNPLHERGRVPAVAGIEYAAQAMAVHGGLLRGDDEAPARGYIAAVRDVAWSVERLDDIACEITVQARRLMGDARSFVYEFELTAGPDRLLGGRATVLLS